MKDLFTPLTRDERQEESVRKWLQAKGKGTIVAATGYGKSRCAILIIKKLLTKYPKLRILIVVPNSGLKEQWEGHIEANQLGLNAEVLIINTAAKTHYQCDLLILDEIHRFPADTFVQVFNIIKYKLILGLTATIERLDGKHVIIEERCPKIDEITIETAKINGWVSNFSEYQVLISVPDIDLYKKYNKEFMIHFEYFNFDFDLVMSMLGSTGFKNKARYRDEICKRTGKDPKEVFKEISYHAAGFMKALQARKKFIANHPKKLEIARAIINARKDKKIITFSSNVRMADAIGIGYVYTGREGKKKNRITIEDFQLMNSGVLNTSQLANEGLDVRGLSVGIVLGVDSSPIKGKQRTGRIIRKESDKYAEMFTIVIDETVECDWYRKSHEGCNYITIDENNLMKVLQGEPYETYKKPVSKFTYRF